MTILWSRRESKRIEYGQGKEIVLTFPDIGASKVGATGLVVRQAANDEK